MTLTYLLSAEVTPDQNRVFSLCLVDLWENWRRYRNDFNDSDIFVNENKNENENYKPVVHENENENDNYFKN